MGLGSRAFAQKPEAHLVLACGCRWEPPGFRFRERSIAILDDRALWKSSGDIREPRRGRLGTQLRRLKFKTPEHGFWMPTWASWAPGSMTIGASFGARLHRLKVSLQPHLGPMNHIIEYSRLN